jgi:hypothetical protein
MNKWNLFPSIFISAIAIHAADITITANPADRRAFQGLGFNMYADTGVATAHGAPLIKPVSQASSLAMLELKLCAHGPFLI